MSSEANSDSEMHDDDESLLMPVGESSNSDFKQSFDEQLIEFHQQYQGSLGKKPWTQVRIIEVINAIKSGRDTMSSGLRRTPTEYYYMSKYDVITVKDEDHLIFKRPSPADFAIRILPREQYFEILSKIHTYSKHGGRDKTLHYVKKKYYIPKKAVQIYVSLCPECRTKRRDMNEVPRQNLSLKLNIRGQLDLIDYQASPDGEFKWLLYYQDEATKFLSLRPLNTNDAAEVTLELMKIFLTFGAPTILQLDNRYDFVATLTEEITVLWSDCKVIHINTQIKAYRQEVEQMISAWMTDNNSTKWSVGCFFVQYEINNSMNQILRRSPYKTMFRCDPKTNLDATDFPASVFSEPENEQKLDIKEEFEYVPGLSSDDDC